MRLMLKLYAINHVQCNLLNALQCTYHECVFPQCPSNNTPCVRLCIRYQLCQTVKGYLLFRDSEKGYEVTTVGRSYDKAEQKPGAEKCPA